MLFIFIAIRKVIEARIGGKCRESVRHESHIFAPFGLRFIMSLYITTTSSTTPKGLHQQNNMPLLLPGKDGRQMFGLMDPGAPLTDIPSIMRSIEHINCQQSSVVDEWIALFVSGTTYIQNLSTKSRCLKVRTSA